MKNLRRTKAFGFRESHSVLLPEKSECYLESNKPKILNPQDFLKHLSSFKLISEEDIISWRSGRKINIENNIKGLNLGNKNGNKYSRYDNKYILVCDQKNNIMGVATLEENFTIKPKVVFNAIG